MTGRQLPANGPVPHSSAGTGWRAGPIAGKLREKYFTVGLPGEGKTTLARELEQADEALRLTPEECRKRLSAVNRQRAGAVGRLLTTSTTGAAALQPQAA